MLPEQFNFQMAINDFQSARLKAGIQEVLARITGKSARLLSYEDVAKKLKLHARTERGVQHIPLNAIVGSVGRYTDFTRTFLPLSDNDRERWSRVKTAFMESNANLPPIEAYKVGEAYFVVDGNHRVSIARQEGLHSIEGRVIEFKTDIPLTPNVQPDDLIIKAEYADFLDSTRINEIRPNVDLNATSCCQYEKLMEQVHVCQYVLQEELGQEISLQDAAANWYDTMYIPLAEAIRDRGLLHWFPNRTITDLYLWISENRAALEKELGWEIQSDIAATDLILERGVKSEPGSWRKSHTVARYTDRLFADILVPLSGFQESWDALDQALIIAKHENAKLHGLHIVETIDYVDSSDSLGVKARFDQTCVAAGVEGNLAIDVGDITTKICERAVLTDLIIVKITNPPAAGISALRSPFRTIVEKSSRPMLTVPAAASPFQRAMLVYDGSDRAKEALFVAAYLTEIWKTELIVFTAQSGARSNANAQDYVRRYLDIHEAAAEYITSEHGSTDYLKKTVEERNIDLMLMGSHSGSMLQQAFTSSVLDYMLRESSVPIFICR